MSSLEIVTPATPPIEATELREHLRIDHAEEDALLAAYLAAACELVSDRLGLAVGQTVYRLTLDRWPAGAVLLPRPQAVSVDAIAYDDLDEAEQTLDPAADVQVDVASRPARILPLPGEPWPDVDPQRIRTIRVTFTAGTDDGVPQRALQAIRLTAGTWYRHRESVTTLRVSKLPDGADRLLNGIRFRDRRLMQFLSNH